MKYAWLYDIKFLVIFFLHVEVSHAGYKIIMSVYYITHLKMSSDLQSNLVLV